LTLQNHFQPHQKNMYKENIIKLKTIETLIINTISKDMYKTIFFIIVIYNYYIAIYWYFSYV